MIWTRANVAEYAEKHGLEPVQVDGVPEGFSFKKPELQIGENIHTGEYIACIPLSDVSVSAETKEELLEIYNQNKDAN